jgi:acetoin:2,6-dichlorophenolindophenol oxidoreductase subunit alpha
MSTQNSTDSAVLLEIYRRAALIKANDERVRKVIGTGRLVMPYYSPRGQEIIPSSISVNLRDDDYIATIYRGTHDMIAKGFPLKPLWAEMAGKIDGSCKGKGGVMHLTYPQKGIMVTTGIVGSSMPIALGMGWSAQLAGTDQVTIAYFGDGAANIGAFHESLNMAALWKLPVVFVCQNNMFAEHTTYKRSTAAARISDRAAGYGMPGVTANGNDAAEMHRVAAKAIELARSGGGPTLIEAMTFRFHGHVLGDDDFYIDKEQKKAAMAADPVIALRALLLERGIATEAELAEMEARHGQEIDEALEFALASPFPPLEEGELDVFAAGAN